jgi:hypothetical protein
MKARFLVIVLGALATVGCSQDWQRFSERVDYLSGPRVDFTDAEYDEYVARQTQVLTQLAEAAQLDGLPPSDDRRWGRVVAAGINRVDIECERYMDSLFWFDRGRRVAQDQLTITGAATAGILGTVGSGAADIAITAIAFGLLSDTLTNTAGGLLYELNPRTVRNLVEEEQVIYRNAVYETEYTTRPGAVQAIQGYLTICLPAHIEARVDTAISGESFETVGDTGPNARPNIVSATRRFVLPREQATQDFEDLRREVVALVEATRNEALLLDLARNPPGVVADSNALETARLINTNWDSNAERARDMLLHVLNLEPGLTVGALEEWAGRLR